MLHKILVYSLPLLVCLSFVSTESICFKNLGCFNDDGPFAIGRPKLLPQCPERIATSYLLYTRKNPLNGYEVLYDGENEKFCVTCETKIAIHGFMDNGFSIHSKKIKDSLLAAGDFNVIIVFWNPGEQYPQAVANTRVVGAEVARLIQSLIKQYNVTTDSFHLIGQSLGAHIAGYAGTIVPNLGRITGLDPAEPLFENTDRIVRLDDSDAKFVDVIHTDGATSTKYGFGLFQKSGHVDFYVNGGTVQPGCLSETDKSKFAYEHLSKGDAQYVTFDLFCDHISAFTFFEASMSNKDCKYISYPCTDYETFKTGSCLNCGSNGCNIMGFNASSSHDTGNLYLNTQDPFKPQNCLQHFAVSLHSNNLTNQSQITGNFTITLTGEVRSTTGLLFGNGIQTLQSNTVERRLLTTSTYIGENIESVEVLLSTENTLDSTPSPLNQQKWSFKNIEIFYGEQQKAYKFCPPTDTIQINQSIGFNKC